MSRRPQIGLVGLGDIAKLHAAAIRQYSGVDLAVCRGVNPAKADSFAREFSAVIYPSYDSMLGEASVLAVVICVPNDLHRAYVERAASACKHVLCEKPIAMTIQDGAAMIEACRNAGVILLIAHPLRFWPEYVRLHAAISNEEFGRCLAVTMRRMLSLLISVQGEDGWRHKPERMGGAVLDLQIHDLDFLCWTFGLPQTVYCTGTKSADGGLNHVYSSLTWDSGTAALVEASYMLSGDPMIFTVKAVCASGSLDYALDLSEFGLHTMSGPDAGKSAPERSASLIAYRPGQEPEGLVRQPKGVLGHVFGTQLAHFADAILGRRAPEVRPESALDALVVALACVESAATGQPVKLKPEAYA